MPQGRTRGGNAPGARTTAAGPPQAPRRRKPPRTSQIGPPAQAGRQTPTSPAAGPPRHGQAATHTRRDDDRPRRERMRHATPRRAAEAPARQTTDEQPPKGGDHDRPRTLKTAQHPDSPRGGRTRRRKGETRRKPRPARETPPKGAAARNCPDSRAGTRSAGDSGQTSTFKARRASGGLSRRPDSRTPGKAENGHEIGKEEKP